MKFADMVKSFLAGGNGDPEEKGKNDPDLDDQNEEGTGGTEGDGMNKSDLLDATEILGALVTELREVNKSLKALSEKQETLEKSQLDVGEAIVCVSEVVGKIAGIPVSPKSVMAKGNLGGTSGAFASQVTQPKTPPTQAEFERAQDVLFKSVQAGEIDMYRAEMISSDMQKSMAYPGYTMKPENYEFLARKMRAA
jgi:hypothetical protein